MTKVQNNGTLLQALLAATLLLIPISAFANFFWPPALYYAGTTVWWGVPAGLVAESFILYPFFGLPPLKLFKVVLLSNVASAVVGFLATWPMIFWEQGIEFLAHGALISVLGIVALIFVGNVFIEYIVSVKWLGVPRQRNTLRAVFAANAVSFVILAIAGFSLLMT